MVIILNNDALNKTFKVLICIHFQIITILNFFLKSDKKENGQNFFNGHL